MSHYISLHKAKEMTARYRAQKETILAAEYRNQNILAICEGFDRVAVDRLLQQPKCLGIRIYYGMDESKKVHAILVGYDDKDQDILPTQTTVNRTLTDDDFEGIVEEGNRCPTHCPPESPLNDDNQP